MWFTPSTNKWQVFTDIDGKSIDSEVVLQCAPSSYRSGAPTFYPTHYPTPSPTHYPTYSTSAPTRALTPYPTAYPSDAPLAPTTSSLGIAGIIGIPAGAAVLLGLTFAVFYMVSRRKAHAATTNVIMQEQQPPLMQ